MHVGDSPAVELTPLRRILELYSHALTQERVDLQDLRQLVEKNIGWSKNDVATTDGVTIFLPSSIDRFNSQAENFEFLKVMLTQQAGHISFGSFRFQFNRPAAKLRNLRLKIQEAPEYHDHDHGHEAEHDRPSVTELTRFFRLFPNKRLAADIFSIFEAARIEALVMREYLGIAKSYEAMRVRALQQRPEMMLLPVREALLEFMVRLSLGQTRGLKMRGKLEIVANEIGEWMMTLLEPGAAVEDAAEATLRAYIRLARISNVHVEPNGFADLKLQSRRLSRARIPDRRESSFTDAGDTATPGALIILPPLSGREREYLSPQSVDYRGDFRPELAQLLSPMVRNSREQRRSLTPEELADLLRTQRTVKRRDSTAEDEQDAQTSQMVQNLLRELDRRDPRMAIVSRRPSGRAEEGAGELSANEPNTFVYDEWSVFENRFRSSWCKVYESIMLPGELSFYTDTLRNRRELLEHIRIEFEQVMPELYRKIKRLTDGTEHDLDAAIEALTDLRVGVPPSEKVFWRQHKIERDVVVAFLLDLSGSTGEAIGQPTEARGSPGIETTHRRIIDVEKEAIVLMSQALEAIGDRFGVYGFSGHGRDRVEFYIIKDLREQLSVEVAKRFGRIGPLHATRMGPAIRHTVVKLRQEQARAKFLFLISDGRPQDRGYSQESSEKEYAVQDTRVALMDARREGIHPFCLTIDKEGNDYLRKMMGDFSYEVLFDVSALPLRLPQLYRKLTM